jgi:hypothetical protein
MCLLAMMFPIVARRSPAIRTPPPYVSETMVVACGTCSGCEPAPAETAGNG